MPRCTDCNRIIAARRKSAGKSPTCPFGWKYGKAGATVNRKHECGPECSWDWGMVKDWLNLTPYPGFAEPPRLIPVPACTRCDRKRSDHWIPAADKVTGHLTGYKPIKECVYAAA